MSVCATVKPGRVFGKLTVIKTCMRDGNRAALCVCACGEERYVRSTDLARPNGTRSCGCRTLGIRVGDRFGHLTVVALTLMDSGKKTRRFAVCACRCGRMRHVQAYNLTKPPRSNPTRSCGQKGCRPAASRFYAAPLTRSFHLGLTEKEFDALDRQARDEGISLRHLVRRRLGLQVPHQTQKRLRNGRYVKAA